MPDHEHLAVRRRRAVHRAGGAMAQLRDGGRRRVVAPVVLALALVATVAAPTRALAGAGPSEATEAAAAGTPLAAGQTTLTTTATNVAARTDRRPVAGGVYDARARTTFITWAGK